MAEDLTGLRQVGSAVVLKGGREAATLTRTPDGVLFAYLASWDGPPVATTLPVVPEPVLRPGGALPAFFAGLLPEGRRLGALRRQVKTSADDELSLLLAVGADAVGDVQVLPEGESAAGVPARVDLGDLAATSFRALLADLDLEVDRVGLPGVQDKVSAAMLNIPVAQRDRQYILKLTPREYPGLVENEHVFVRAARLAGVNAVRAELVHDRDGRPGLLVERFDRGAGSGTGMRAVEDGCQVRGRPPGDKYLSGSAAVLGALAAVCQAPLPAARTFLSQLAFAYLTGNGDAHAKNFSVLQSVSGEWRPSPAYDLPSSQPYGDTTMALSIGGRTSGDVGRDDFATLAADLGLPTKAADRVLDAQRDRVDAWIPLLDELPYDSGRVSKLARVVRHRRDRLR